MLVGASGATKGVFVKTCLHYKFGDKPVESPEEVTEVSNINRPNQKPTGTFGVVCISSAFKETHLKEKVLGYIIHISNASPNMLKKQKLPHLLVVTVQRTQTPTPELWPSA